MVICRCCRVRCSISLISVALFLGRALGVAKLTPTLLIGSAVIPRTLVCMYEYIDRMYIQYLYVRNTVQYMVLILIL